MDEHGIRISDDEPFMFDNGCINGEFQTATIYYKGSKIEFTGIRDNGAFDIFKDIMKSLSNKESTL